MTTLPDGVTRFDRIPTRRLRKPLWIGDAVLVAVGVAVALVAPLVRGAEAPWVLGLAAVGFVIPLATYPLSGRARAVVLVAVWIGGVVFLGRFATGFNYASAWFGGLVTGFLILTRLLYFKQWRARNATAVGAPPSGLNPQQGTDVGVLAAWDDGDHDYEMVDPRLDVVLDAVRRLDGRSRTAVTIWRGKGRLDVGGDARGAMVVAGAPDRVRYSLAVDPAAVAAHGPSARTPETVVVGFGRTELTYPRGQTTDLAGAERAMTTWLERGALDEGLTWWQESAGDRALRPASLRFHGN